MSIVVHEAAAGVSLVSLEDKLARALNAIRGALDRGDVDAQERLRWIERLAASGAASGSPEVVAFLASERASYVTGQFLLACGGRSVAG